jgi:hypothetical protein
LKDLVETGDTDNTYPTQYILTHGKIHYSDQDQTYNCSFPQMDGCPNTEAALLEANCWALLGGVVQHTNPDCSPTYSAKEPVADPTQHIDIAKAQSHGYMDFVGFWQKHFLQY